MAFLHAPSAQAQAERNLNLANRCHSK